MTTIAYRDGVMAGDRRATANSTIEHQCTKVFRRADGVLIGIAGALVDCRAFADWMLAGEADDKKPTFDAKANFEALVVRPAGLVEWHCNSGWMRAEGAMFAIGTGAPFALGAMEMGADAEKAVEIACRRDCHSGNGIDVVRTDADAWIASRAA